MAVVVVVRVFVVVVGIVVSVGETMTFVVLVSVKGGGIVESTFVVGVWHFTSSSGIKKATGAALPMLRVWFIRVHCPYGESS